MKFLDEVVIQVQGGKGGDGCLGFRREKFIPFGGPDGGDGGDGGCIYLKVTAINTLVDFRPNGSYRAQNGCKGQGNNKTGRKGENLILPVPRGTQVYDAETEQLLVDLTEMDREVIIAHGGKHGLGNARFKSSTNQAPRRTTPGALGETRLLRFSLKLLADVGLVGLPNAGKSTLIRQTSAATPKVADYPFTTLHPYLGVVKVGLHRNFLMADIPGLIEGASKGAGLGVQFLKHLERTKLLLHLISLDNQEGSVAENFSLIRNELANFSDDLANKPMWVILNKTDLLNPDEVKAKYNEFIEQTRWLGKVFLISAQAKINVIPLCGQIMDWLEDLKPEV